MSNQYMITYHYGIWSVIRTDWVGGYNSTSFTGTSHQSCIEWLEQNVQSFALPVMTR